MKNKIYNETHIEGWLYEHNLKERVSGPNSKNPGTKYLNGEISIATDETCLNVIKVRYSYVTDAHRSYAEIMRIFEGAPSVTQNGIENAVRLRVDSSVGVNDWYNKDNTLVSTKINEGGFVHFMSANEELSEDMERRSAFKTDIILTGVREIENPETGKVDKAVLNGYIFNFKKEIFPVEYTITSAEGIKYFQKLDCSKNNPVFTRVWGQQVSQTVTTEVVEESAFGEASVSSKKSSVKEFRVMHAQKEPYVWDDEEAGISVAELKKALADRELYLADVKKRSENRGTASEATKPVVNPGTYNLF